ncbi:MAG: hypothetical protein PVJ05_02310 [Candidatus Thorarchaeota archaeon]
MDDSTPTGEGVNMDVRLRRVNKSAVLTLLIILTTGLVSVWLENPPPPISWEKEGSVSYSDTIFDIEIPTSSNITYYADMDEAQNTSRIYVEINTELIMTRGLLSFEMESTYITLNSWYSTVDSREATLSSGSSSEYWNTTSYENRPFGGWTIDGSNETYQQNRTLPTEYSMQMIWNSSLTLVEERNNDTSFDVYLRFWIYYIETQIQVDPTLLKVIIVVECIVGIAVTVGFYIFDKPEVID